MNLPQKTIGLFVSCWLFAPGASAAEAPRFDRDVRPILAQACFHCHGPDAEHREADLRLDQEEGIRHVFGTDGIAKSAAWARINSNDPDLRMPPPDAPHQLKPKEVETLRLWIEDGAKWRGHWSLVAPTRPQVPIVNDAAWSKNPIDAFILARLQEEKLSHSPPADRERLLRRVTFDLTGLPPTIEEIDAFLADKSSNAYEKVVDRLLASPHYGERMAIAWLDAARYGDSSVFHADGPRTMWPWRDWVIQAYNSNKPFDEFTIEQLAGDLLPNATLEQKIATGFNRNNATTDEGGAISEEFRVEYAVDRVKTTTQVWLGLTMECAQCHDHKYDPISQRDYYRFFAYFNQAADPGLQTRKGNSGPVADVFDPQSLAKAEQLKRRLAPLEAAMTQHKAKLQTEFEAWAKTAATNRLVESQLPKDVHAYLPLDETSGSKSLLMVGNARRDATVVQNASWTQGRVAGGLYLSSGSFVDAGDVGNFERNQAFSYGGWIKPVGGSNGAALARMDVANRHRGYDLFVYGNRVQVHLIHSWPDNAIKVIVKSTLKPDVWQHVFVTYDGSGKAAGIKVYFDGQPQAWVIEQDRLTDSIRTNKPLFIGSRNPGAAFSGGLDDVRIYARALREPEVAILAGRGPIDSLLAKEPDARTDVERATLMSHYLANHDVTHQTLTRDIAQLKAEIAVAQRPISNVMVMQDVPQPRMTYVLDRGNYHSPRKDEPVQPGVPASLPALPEGAAANRLGLAQWLVRPEHPLTARVTMNRFWEMLMGNGIVRTVEDFGAQGEMPSHEQLLDWLAVDFVENGWDVKRALKQIVMSQTYQQSSRLTPEIAQRDPENLLYARGPRFRLQGEFIRDNALAASGLLVPTVGGPSVKPYQPAGLWEEVSLIGERYVQDRGDKLYRRTLYTFIKRSAPAPTLLIFDAPTREKCALRRPRTNTPLQALVTMNDPQFVEAARVLAERTMKQDGATLDEQITFAYRLVTGLTPSPLALETFKQAHANELAIYQADEARAKKLLAVGETKRDEAIDAAHHAAMTIVCSMIFNLDVTLSRN